MGKKAKEKKAEAKKAEKKEKDDGLVEVDPATVYFTHSRIRPQFSCGRRVADTLKELEEGQVSPADLPPITFIASVTPCGLGPPYFSLNNRRLYCYKALRSKGLLQTVRARLKPPLDSKRERDRYTTEKCSLTARLMGIKNSKSPGDEDGGGDDDDGDDGSSSSGREEGSPKGSRQPAAVPKLPWPHSWKKDCFDTTVYAVDANSLQPRKWLRDPVLSFGFAMVERAARAKGVAVKWAAPAVTLMVLSGAAPASALEELRLGDAEVALFAVNDSKQECPVSGSHWSLLAWRRSPAGWTSADSFGAANAEPTRRLAAALHPLFAEGEPTPPEPWADQKQQANTSDCGVMTLLHAAAVAGVADAFPADPAALRQFLIDALWRCDEP